MKVHLIMTRYYYISLFFFLMGTSCTYQKNGNDNILIDLETLTKDTLYYSSFVDSLSYISLETGDECLIGEITDVIFTSRYIFILDNHQQTVWAFFPSGQFSHAICRRGEAPDEYIKLVQFEYDSLNEELLLLDGWSKSVLRYTVSGDFIGRVTFDIYPGDFKKTFDGYLLSLLGAPDSIAGVYHYDVQANEYVKLVGRSHNLSCGFDWEMVSYDDTIAFMAPPFDNMVYHYKEKGEVYGYLPFQMLPHSEREYEYTASKQDLPDFIRTNYIEGNRWIYATYWCAKYGVRAFLYDKRKQEYALGSLLVNDMDDKGFSYLSSACDDNRFVFGCASDDGSNPELQILYLK